LTNAVLFAGSVAMTSVQGFIVSAWDERSQGAPRRTFATGRLVDGRSFALVMPAPPAAIYVPLEHGERALAVVATSHGARLDAAPWSTFEGQSRCA
jgi:hypothetical protein